MTVSELIEKLQQQDQTAQVVYLNVEADYEGVNEVSDGKFYGRYSDGEFGTNVVELA